MIEGLIDKRDNFEIVRDQIAGILAAEIANQVTYGSDINFLVTVENSAPVERWLNTEQWDDVDETPVVNVTYETTSFNRSASSTFHRQSGTGVFNVDAYALGVSRDNPDGGHTLGDVEAAFRLDSVVRMVRNILTSAQNYQLGLRGVVSGLWIPTVTRMRPEYNGQALQNIAASRIVLEVGFMEFSPQVEGHPFEQLHIEVSSTTGEVMIIADYPEPSA